MPAACIFRTPLVLFFDGLQLARADRSIVLVLVPLSAPPPLYVRALDRPKKLPAAVLAVSIVNNSGGSGGGGGGGSARLRRAQQQTRASSLLVCARAPLIAARPAHLNLFSSFCC